MTMMNNANQNSSSTRPVMLKDIAEKLGMPIHSVSACLQTHSKMAQKKIELVRQTAEEMGYDAMAVRSYNGAQTKGKPRPFYKTNVYGEKTCPSCGTAFTPASGSQIYCHVCKATHRKEHNRVYSKIRRGGSMNYWNGNFKTKEEEIARMKELRAMGYSNHEIAKAVGRTDNTVRCNIGKQDRELWRQNTTMAAKYRAQKNAARKQYVVNKPIREYNRKVEAHNKLKAQVAQMELELKPQINAIEKAAQTKIEFPMMQMETVKPVALQ